MSSYIDYSVKVGLSLLLVFKFYFFTRGFFFSNFNSSSLLLQSGALFILNFILILLSFKVLDFFYETRFIYNLLLTCLVSLLSVYTIKTFFYFVNIISFKDFFFNFVLQNLDFKYAIKIILTFIFPYIFFFVLFFFYKKKENYLKFLSILGYLFLLNFVYTIGSNFYFQYSKHEISDFKPYTFKKKELKLDRKVVWIIFDAFDPKYAFENEIVSLKNFNKLSKNSIYFSHALSPSDDTIRSMTANLIGSRTNGVIVNKKSIEIISPDQSYIKFKKENTIFGRLEKSNLNYEVYSSTLDYCNLLKIKNCKAKKYEDGNFSTKWYSGINLTYPILSQLNLFVSLFKEKVPKEILKMNFLFSELNFDFYQDELYQIKDIDGEGIVDYDKIKNFLNSNSSLLFIHLYLPHTPANYIKEKLSLITENINQDYYLNLLYTDYVLSRILRVIDESEQQDLMLVLNSDHWYNSGEEFDKIERPVLQLLKIKNENNSKIFDNPISTHYTQEIIHKYLNEELKNSDDILNFVRGKK